MGLQETIGDIEHELDLAHATINELQDRTIKAELERDSLRDQLYLTTQERDEAQRLATQIETILEHTSMGLVQGVQKMRDDRAKRRASRNQLFEDALAHGETVPLFIRNQLRGRAAAQGAMTGRTPQPQGEGATLADITRPAPTPSQTAAPSPARYEPAHDPRLPGPVLVDQREAADADARRLAELAAMIAPGPKGTVSTPPMGPRGRDIFFGQEDPS